MSGSATLADYPLLFSVMDPDLRTANKGGAVRSASGLDILFTPGDSVTKLAHEIERYDGGTGALTARVRVPQLSRAADTAQATSLTA